MNNILKISASLALTAGMIFTANNFPYDSANKVLLNIDGNQATYLTKQKTIRDFLRENGVTLNADDQINLPVSNEIDGNETLLIKKAIPVTVSADGNEIKVNTLYKDVRSLLSSLGITVTAEDRMNVAATAEVTENMAITITRIEVKEETRVLPVAHSSLKIDSADLLKGKEKVKQIGMDGEREVTTKYTYSDGKLISSEVVGDFLAKAPITETVLEGTKAPIVAKKVVQPKAKTVKAVEKKTTTVKRTSAKETTTSNQNWKSFTLTFYTNLPSENGGYTITATGKSLRFGMVASNYYSMGKKIYLTDYGTMTVEDRGGANFNSSSRLDVFIPRKSGESNSSYLNRVNNMGIKTVKGYVK